MQRHCAFPKNNLKERGIEMHKIEIVIQSPQCDRKEKKKQRIPGGPMGEVPTQPVV